MGKMNTVLWGTNHNKNIKVTFGDDNIIREDKEWTIIYPYGFIEKISYSFSCINIDCKDHTSRTLLYIKAKDRDEKKYIKEIARQAQTLTYNKPFESMTEIPKEHYKYCNVCGHLFCYTGADLRKNFQHQVEEVLANRRATLNALSLNAAAVETANQTALDAKNQIVDYDKCPSCGSKSLRDITLEEFRKLAEKTKGATPSESVLSATDELKKYKELLDSGVITQEEFDAKKKQLLNL